MRRRLAGARAATTDASSRSLLGVAEAIVEPQSPKSLSNRFCVAAPKRRGAQDWPCTDIGLKPWAYSSSAPTRHFFLSPRAVGNLFRQSKAYMQPLLTG